MRFIGDVHGKISRYLEKLDDKTPSLQIGDMGIGFSEVVLPERKYDLFFRGNHDSPSVCRAHPNYAGDFGYLKEHNVLFISGADSIDKNMRVAYVSWWPDEQLEYKQFDEAINLALMYKPRIIASHDCPQTIKEKVLKKILLGSPKIGTTRTNLALQSLYEQYQPEIWIFGHYHMDLDFIEGNTRFICLNELSVIDL